MPNIYDCCIFYNELDMLELRMNVLGSVVDYFVVCEAAETHSGNPKPYNFAANRERFAQWADKIIYVQVDDLTGEGRNSWEREYYHRSRIADGLSEAASDDWIIVADCDEIPDPRAVWELLHFKAGIVSAKFELEFYYYDMNHRVSQGWAIGACRHYLENDPNKIRTCAHGASEIYDDAGWHFSWFGGTEQMLTKHASFMHHDDPVIRDMPRDPAYLMNTIAANGDLFGRDLKIVQVPLSDSLPRYVLDHEDRYRSLGWISPT